MLEIILNNKYTSGNINYPIDLFIIENNPNFFTVKVTKLNQEISKSQKFIYKVFLLLFIECIYDYF